MVHILGVRRKVHLQEIMMDTMQIKNMEDISKNHETLQLEVIIKEIIQKVSRIGMITNILIVKMIVILNLHIKEGMISTIVKNQIIIEAKTIKTKGKKEMIQMNQMKEVKCHMRVIELKINQTETLLKITKEEINSLDQITMIETETIVISKDSWMQPTKKITMNQITQKM